MGLTRSLEMFGTFAKGDIALLIFKLTSSSPTVFRSSPTPRYFVPSFISFLAKRGIAVPILKLTSSPLSFSLRMSACMERTMSNVAFSLTLVLPTKERYYSADLQVGVVFSIISPSISTVMERTISNAGFCGFLLNVIVRRPLIPLMAV